MSQKQIKAIILDDEIRATNVLRILIDKHLPRVGEVYISNDPISAIDLVKSVSPDLIFLDIQMPKMNGFEFLECLEEQDFEVVFTTAYSEYAIKAIRISAMDYLLKPININELKLSFNRFEEKVSKRIDRNSLIRNLQTNLLTQDRDGQKIALTSTDGTHFIPIRNIVRCEASSNYTYFYLIDGNRYLSSKTLKEYNDILASSGFIRTHRSHLININYIKHIQGYHVVLLDGSQVEISRRRKIQVTHEFRKLIK